MMEKDGVGQHGVAGPKLRKRTKIRTFVNAVLTPTLP